MLVQPGSGADAVPGGSSQPKADPGAQAAPVVQKPAWLTDLSVGAKESYDNNVFLSGVDAKDLPATYALPAGSVAALKNRSSWITTISPKVGVNFAPLLGDQKTIQAIALGYAPDFATFHGAESEDYNIHRVSGTLKGKADAFSFQLEDSVNYIDGSKFGPTYPGALLNAYGTGTLRERREQYQDRGKVTLQYDQEKWFVRPNATLLYYDLLTEKINTPGYQNYADRYDVNGGVDFGYKFQPNFAGTIGYRYGHQYQEKYKFSAAEYSSPSDYQRVLFGVEGKPWKWLTVSLQAGPDFRNYADGAQVENQDLVTYYGEASLTAVATANDTFSFKYKQWQWVSSTGRIPYFDSLFELGYTRKFTDRFSGLLGLRAVGSDYTSANNALRPTIGNRNDWQYTASAGLKYAFNNYFSADVAYSYDLGRNAQDGLSPLQERAREFDHQLFSVGAQFKF